MPDVAPPFQFASRAGHCQNGSLTPERIERVLAEFRDWLTELPPANDEPAPASEPVDLHALIGQFVALRHEVNLQTKAARASLEQNAAALRQLEETVAEIRNPPPKPEVEEAVDLKPLLKMIVDIYDALAMAVRQVEKQKTAIFGGLDTVLDSAAIEAPPEGTSTGMRPGFWARLFGAVDPATNALTLMDWHRRVTANLQQREQKVREACDFLKQALDGLLIGYTMSLNRIDRALPAFGLEAMNCAGQRFDPETMEVVDTVAGSNRAAGEVVEEVRRGYRWNDQIFRYAQVRVAR